MPWYQYHRSVRPASSLHHRLRTTTTVTHTAPTTTATYPARAHVPASLARLSSFARCASRQPDDACYHTSNSYSQQQHAPCAHRHRRPPPPRPLSDRRRVQPGKRGGAHRAAGVNLRLAHLAHCLRASAASFFWRVTRVCMSDCPHPTACVFVVREERGERERVRVRVVCVIGVAASQASSTGSPSPVPVCPPRAGWLAPLPGVAGGRRRAAACADLDHLTVLYGGGRRTVLGCHTVGGAVPPPPPPCAAHTRARWWWCPRVVVTLCPGGCCGGCGGSVRVRARVALCDTLPLSPH